MKTHSAMTIASIFVLLTTEGIQCFIGGQFATVQSSLPISPRNGKLMILFESNSRIGPSADDMIDITIDTAVDIFDATSIGKLEANNFIQLLPNKEPYVSIEEAPSNARRIFTGVDIMADMESIWEVLTAFEKLQDVVPSLVQNEVVFRTAEGGARLAQVGGAKVLPGVTFTAKTVLDVTVFTECNPMPDSMLTNRTEKMSLLVRGIFPRPDCISSLPHRDIAIQNVLGEGDFDHYQGVWRMQSLPNCAPNGGDASRLTYAVEIKPKGILPVKLIEGRIATDLKSNLAAIRDYVEKMCKISARSDCFDLSDSGNGCNEGDALERGDIGFIEEIRDDNTALSEGITEIATICEEDLTSDFSIESPRSPSSEERTRQQLVLENEGFKRIVALLEMDLGKALKKIRDIRDLSTLQLEGEVA